MDAVHAGWNLYERVGEGEGEGVDCDYKGDTSQVKLAVMRCCVEGSLPQVMVKTSHFRRKGKDGIR